ncbi:MAG TPA: RES family NAD+ phosphorylase [Verrucomicrobiae bacterium]|jgi:hypothetical protein
MEAKLPPPPPDLHARPLPVTPLTGLIFRIHRTGLDCLHFGKSGAGRFDDPHGRYGVLYASLQPEGAFAEVFLRGLSLMLVREADFTGRSMSGIACKSLMVVDLTGAGLRKVSCDNRISTEIPFHTVGLWSGAFFAHPRQPDGIIYRSRHNPRFKCVALFDRCKARLGVEPSEALITGRRRQWTANQIDKYGLAIE